LVFVANETTVLRARSQLRPGNPWGLSGREPCAIRMRNAIAIWAMLRNSAAKKYCRQPMVMLVSTPVRR